MRVVLAIALVFALGGCAVVAVPPAVTIASYAADGISYLATGKSLTDHAVSEVADEDCVLMRAALLKNPCRPYVKPDSELAVELETSYGGEDVSTELADADLAAGHDRRGRRSMVAERPTSAATLAATAPAHTVSARTASDRRYVVVGSFRERANAERARRANAARGAAIVPASVGGQAYYRVVTRPAAAPSGAAWTIAPCAQGAGHSPCLDHASVALVRGPGVKHPTSVAEHRTARPDSQLSETRAARGRGEIDG